MVWGSRCFTGWGRNGPGRRPVTQSGVLATKCSRRSHCCCLFLCSWSFASFRFRQLLFVFLLRLIQSLACFCFLFRHQEQEATASLNPGIVSRGFGGDVSRKNFDKKSSPEASSLSLSRSRESFATASFRNFVSFLGVVVLGEKLKEKRGWGGGGAVAGVVRGFCCSAEVAEVWRRILLESQQRGTRSGSLF